MLAEKCQVRVSASALHDFVRSRSLGKKKSAGQVAADQMKRGMIAPNGIWATPGQRSSADEKTRPVKARQRVRKPKDDIDFDYDPTQPLHLIPQDKLGRDDE